VYVNKIHQRLLPINLIPFPHTNSVSSLDFIHIVATVLLWFQLSSQNLYQFRMIFKIINIRITKKKKN